MRISQVIDVFIFIQQIHFEMDNISKKNHCDEFLFLIEEFEFCRPTLSRQWHWQSSPDICDISHSLISDIGTCSCLISNGTFAITSDMFDPNVN